jgi:threonine dehydratase
MTAPRELDLADVLAARQRIAPYLRPTPHGYRYIHSLAAVLAQPGRFAGRQVAVVCSGGNISPAQLTALWPRDPA